MNRIPITEYEKPDKHLTPADYDKALGSQNACNLSGIVKWLAVILDKIWQEAHDRGKGTDWVNQHPICRLVGEQIYFLSSRDYHDASFYCEERAKK